MRNRGTLLIYIAGASVLGLFGCNSGSSSSGKSVYFGPGSAPNSPTAAASLGAGAGTLTVVSPLNNPRGGHTTTALSDGRVLVTGGEGDPNAAVGLIGGQHTEAEIYDPIGNVWELVSAVAANQGNPDLGRMMDTTNAFPTGRTEHTAVVAQSGLVVIAGGIGYDTLNGAGQPNFPTPLQSAYVFDPNTSAFTKVADMPVPRYFHLGIQTVTGEIIEAAGFNAYRAGAFGSGQQSLKSADLFNPGTGAWESLGGTPNAPAFSDGHTWGNFINIGQDSFLVNGVHVDDLTQVQQFTEMNVHGIQPGVVMPGTTGSGGGFAGRGEIFDPQARNFAPGPTPLREPTPSGVMLGGAATLGSGDVFFAGGENLTPTRDVRFFGALFTTELLDFNSKTFSVGPELNSSGPVVPPAVPPPTSIPRTGLECVAIGQTGDVLVVGGLTPGQQGPFLNPLTEVYSQPFNVMIGTITLNAGRHDHGAVSLIGGLQSDILLVGGLTEQMAPIADVEVWQR